MHIMLHFELWTPEKQFLLYQIDGSVAYMLYI